MNQKLWTALLVPFAFSLAVLPAEAESIPIHRKSVISALDGRTKLSFLLLYAFMMIIVDNGRSLFILFTLTLLFHFLGKTPVYKWKVLSIFLLLGLWGSISSQALFFSQNPRTPLIILTPVIPALW